MTFRHILVATDFSDSAERAVEVAIEMARKFDAELTVVHVWDVPPTGYGALYLPGDLATPLHKAAAAALAKAGGTVCKVLPRAQTSLRQGLDRQEILAGAEQAHADLIVVGTHGRRGLSRALLGSVAERVVRLSPVPVLTIHATTAAKAS
ncbi:MAG TPA: universal stress protein [Polyangiaceae bacterium]